MALSVFADRSKLPAEPEIAAELGNSFPLWQELKNNLLKTYAPVTQAWRYYNSRSGWTLVLKHHRRTVLYLLPGRGYFTVMFVFGEKAVEAAHRSDLPQEILDRIDQAEPYVEGRTFQVQVRSSEDCDHVMKLAAVKLARS